MLQPEIKKLQEKHKGNSEARAKAQQELFRKHNYNPLAGCLPIFIQMPVFIGLYRSLMVAIELRDAPLFTHSIRWCSNLAAPDMLFDWGGSADAPMVLNEGVRIFALGPYFNLLPILTIVLFIVQQKMFMPPATDPQAAAAAEDDAVHDDLHGRAVLQGGQRIVHLLHRIEPVGPGRTPLPAKGHTRRRRQRGNQGRGEGRERAEAAAATRRKRSRGDC